MELKDFAISSLISFIESWACRGKLNFLDLLVDKGVSDILVEEVDPSTIITDVKAAKLVSEILLQS